MARTTGSCGPARTMVRVAAVSHVPPFHDHRARGVSLEAVGAMALRAAHERPDFICFPEACASVAEGLERGVETAPEREPFVAAAGRIAREVGAAVVVPFLERDGVRVYNSVPVVDRHGDMVLVCRKSYPTTGELEAGITPGTEAPGGCVRRRARRCCGLLRPGLR